MTHEELTALTARIKDATGYMATILTYSDGNTPYGLYVGFGTRGSKAIETRILHDIKNAIGPKYYVTAVRRMGGVYYLITPKSE